MFTIGKINIDLPVNDNKHWDEKLENNMGDGGDGRGGIIVIVAWVVVVEKVVVALAAVV